MPNSVYNQLLGSKLRAVSLWGALVYLDTESLWQTQMIIHANVSNKTKERIQMKTLFNFLFYLTLFILISCREQDDPTLYGSYKLNSSIPCRGFQFSNLRIINCLIEPISFKPDFIVLAQVDNNEVIGPFLANLNGENVFYSPAKFNDLESAQKYFDNYKLPEEKYLEPAALNIKPFQIWVIKTNYGGFGKILITFAKGDTIENNTPFAEIEFKAERM